MSLHISPIVRRHPLASFFTLAYALSWGSFYVLHGPALFPFGAILAAIVVAGVSGGRDGLRDLLSRCVRWRVGLRWYAAALAVPVGLALIVMALNRLLGAPMSPAGRPAPWYEFFRFFPLALHLPAPSSSKKRPTRLPVAFCPTMVAPSS